VDWDCEKTCSRQVRPQLPFSRGCCPTGPEDKEDTSSGKNMFDNLPAFRPIEIGTFDDLTRYLAESPEDVKNETSRTSSNGGLNTNMSTPMCQEWLSIITRFHVSCVFFIGGGPSLIHTYCICTWTGSSVDVERVFSQGCQLLQSPYIGINACTSLPWRLEPARSCEVRRHQGCRITARRQRSGALTPMQGAWVRFRTIAVCRTRFRSYGRVGSNW
jgi:hypothetical protein